MGEFLMLSSQEENQIMLFYALKDDKGVTHSLSPRHHCEVCKKCLVLSSGALPSPQALVSLVCLQLQLLSRINIKFKYVKRAAGTEREPQEGAAPFKRWFDINSSSILSTSLILHLWNDLAGQFVLFNTEAKAFWKIPPKNQENRGTALSALVYSQAKLAAVSPPAMLPASCSGLVILLILRGTNGDSVTQTEDPITLAEGAPLTLNCTYQSSYSVSLFCGLSGNITA
ncbi:uncharacterized protein [Equus przewalskii]|uniref:Ig-like domain-containing protein n=1 Tax=Equus przewalskii TaxID=9798 RepID=A0ABM4LYN8_EQUPR